MILGICCFSVYRREMPFIVANVLFVGIWQDVSKHVIRYDQFKGTEKNIRTKEKTNTAKRTN